jgi:glutaredoxin
MQSMSVKALFWILAGLASAGYWAYGKYVAPQPVPVQERIAGSGQKPGEGERLETNHPAYYGTMEQGGPVLRMKPETAAGLAKISSSAQVVMFATSWCPYCAKARAVFARNGVRYTELDIERDAQAKQFLEGVMGLSGYPTIVIGNRVTRGFNEGQILASLKEI